MANKSFDIKLNGEQYMFSKAPGIELGAALTEPGRPSEVGSLVVSSFHRGIGRGFENGVFQYKQGFEVDLTVPTYMLPGYTLQNVGNWTPCPAPSVMRPSFGYADGGDKVFVVAGQEARYFSPGNPGGGLTSVSVEDGCGCAAVWPCDSEFSGSVFQYNNEILFGVIDTSSGNEGKPAAYAKSAVGSEGTVDLDTTCGDEISYGTSTRARSFWIEADTGLRWAPWVNGATFKGDDPANCECSDTDYIEKPSSGPGIEVGLPRISWMTMVGSALILFRQDGVILGGDETGLLTVAGTTPLNGLDPNFGHRSIPWHDGVLVPGRNGLWSFDIQALTMRPASPNYLQAETDERLRGECTAAGGIGPYAYVALRQVDACGGITSRLYEIVRYRDSIAVHDLIPETAANEVITDILPFYDTSTRSSLIYYLVHNESTDNILVRYVRRKLPNDQHTAGTNISSGSYVELPSIAGPTPAANMTKLWTQVRGYLHLGSGACDCCPPQLDFSGFTIDGSAVTLASVTGDGPFAVPFGGTVANRIGREMTAGRVTLTDPTYDSRIDLPLIFDYVWIPSTQDAVTLNLLVSSEVQGNVSSLWRKAPWGTTKSLLALRDTTVTLDFPEGDQWTVLVVDVQVGTSNIKEGGSQEERSATIELRRLA